MNIPKEFLEMVENDIKRIDECLKGTHQQQAELFLELDGRYQSCINNWYNSMQGTNPQHTTIQHFKFKTRSDMLIDNLKLAKSKLKSFKYGVNVASFPEYPANQININNSNAIQVNITFEDVRSQVDDMTSLTEEETKEILERIDELEEIVNSKDKKKTKWQKVAQILKWLAEKSCDVGMVLLPLILKIQEQ